MNRRFDCRRAGLAASAVAWAAFASAGCGSADTTRIDVSVTVDPALNLQDVTIDVQGGGRPQLEKTFPVGGTGVSGAAPIVWQVLVSNSRAFAATVTASGHLGGSSAVVVTDARVVNVWPGQHWPVQLTLSAACAMKTCPSGQICSGGGCVNIPITGPSLDAGATASGGRAGNVGGSGHGGGAGRGGGAGSSQPVDAHGIDAAADATGSGGGGGHDGGMTDAAMDAGPGKSPIGRKCSNSSECGSGFCAQGVCCSTACTQSCYACTNALTGSSPDGTCAVVSSGLGDPAGACVAGTATSCGNTGHCDGKGACEKFGSSTVCQAATCGTSGFTAAGTCSGKGTCTPGATTDCKGFTCSASSGCATTCSTDSDCPGGYCTSAKTCAVTVADGGACSKDTQCTHANCVAGICCATACAGTCMTCATGLCKPVAAGGSSAGACAPGTTACGHDGTCDGNGGCRFATSSVSCGTAACSGGQLTPAGTCNGAGACSTPGASSCAGGVVCASAGACKSSTCAADGDCVSGLCSGGACASKRANGQACTAANQCTSNFCVDGVCCNTACNGTCQSCAESTSGHSPGTCATIAGTPHSGHGSCTGSGTCASTCDGSSPSCVFPGSSKSCRSASCSGGVQTLAAACDGAGNCPTAVTQSCGSFTCGPTSCLTSCSSASQCVSGAVCTGSPAKCTSCSGGQSACSSGCANLSDDSSNCGACGNKCGSNRSCQSSSCACQGYAFSTSCGGCGSWSFESGMAEGWGKDMNPNFPVNGGGSNGFINATGSTTQKHDGSWALAVPILDDGITTTLGSVAVPLCANGAPVSLGGFTMSAWIRIHNDAGTSLGPLSFLMFSAWSTSATDNEPALFGDQVATTDTWYHPSVTFTSDIQADHIAIYVTPSPNQWSGTIYIDSVTLTPP